jgi:hypothetical protein
VLPRAFLSLAASALALSACTRTSPPDPTPARPASCAPDHPRRLVMQVSRSVLPIGPAPATQQTGSIGGAADCAGKDFCSVVTTEVLDAVYARARPAMSVRHLDGGASPHYGARFIQLHFEGGECEVGDSSMGVITPEDMPVFDAAFDAIANAYAPPGDAQRSGGK